MVMGTLFGSGCSINKPPFGKGGFAGILPLSVRAAFSRHKKKLSLSSSLALDLFLSFF
jgi:hypothetical protein